MDRIIAMDFDGVVNDIGFLKSTVAFELYKIKIPGFLLESQFVKAGKTPLNFDQYKKIRRIVYKKDDYVLSRMRPLPNAVRSINSLIENNFIPKIITARQGESLEAAKIFSKKIGFIFDFTGVGYEKSKLKAIKESESLLYIDDDIKVISDLAGKVSSLIHINVLSRCGCKKFGALHAKNWQELNKIIYGKII